MPNVPFIDHKTAEYFRQFLIKDLNYVNFLVCFQMRFSSPEKKPKLTMVQWLELRPNAIGEA